MDRFEVMCVVVVELCGMVKEIRVFVVDLELCWVEEVVGLLGLREDCGVVIFAV